MADHAATPPTIEPAEEGNAELQQSRDLVFHELDPFAYWPHYASGIPGFGGTERPHEPRYCFCTVYILPTPGRATYVVRFTGVRVTKGEIALRVHGLKLSDPPEMALISSGYIPLDDLEGDTIEYRIDFSVQEDVHYALFAYFNEPSDIHVDKVNVTLHERGESVPIHANLGNDSASRLAKSRYAASTRLIVDTPPAAPWALSHACPRSSAKSGMWLVEFPGLAEIEPDHARKWEAIVALHALDLAAADAKGARGLLIDVQSPAIEAVLHRHSVESEHASLAGAADAGEAFGTERAGAFDFVVCHSLKHAGLSADAQLRIVGEAVQCLRSGGPGVFVVPFWSGRAQDPAPSAAADCLDRNAVQQIALRLIGQGYSVSQMVFPDVRPGEGEITSYALNVCKLL